MLIDNLAENVGSWTQDHAEPSPTSRGRSPLTDGEVIALLERRFGRTYTRQRLGIERDHEIRMSMGGIRSFQIDNWYSSPWLVRSALRIAGLHRRAQQNAARVVVRENAVRSKKIPAFFHGYAILHITDLHADISEGAMHRLADLLPDLNYDLCVLTGDYRGKTYGPFARHWMHAGSSLLEGAGLWRSREPRHDPDGPWTNELDPASVFYGGH